MHTRLVVVRMSHWPNGQVAAAVGPVCQKTPLNLVTIQHMSIHACDVHGRWNQVCQCCARTAEEWRQQCDQQFCQATLLLPTLTGLAASYLVLHI